MCEDSSEQLRLLVYEIKFMRSRIEKLERDINALMATKNIGVGILIALVAIAGGVGALLNKIIGN